ncbi:MAG: hypothetical protein M1819_004363 [Sarea resinae]|nr:MAG: hypothetical protein M1819_004363 [Sarea resinae]
MASSVLGKRSRADTIAAEPSSISARVKRRSRSRAAPDNDENDNPFVVRRRSQSPEDIDMLDDELASPLKTRTRLAEKSVPAKHTVTGGRIALSPNKINAHFKTTKAVPDVATKEALQRTPQTPRHRDALSKKVPITPRHRVTVAAKPYSPRTPRTPSTPNSLPTIYNAARQLFVRSAIPERLVGREAERFELEDFVQTRVTKKTGGCMYVSGPPGTGKSAFVNEVCKRFDEMETVRMAYYNCMSAKTTKDIHGKLVEDLCENADEIGEDELDTLRRLFVSTETKSSSVFVVVLDEIDHLLTLDLEMLYTLFEWSLQRSSRLILVGIANALDLTDRFLPRLKARNLRPQLLPFLPYSSAQICSIITSRLKSLAAADGMTASDFIPFLQPAAIQLCSKKVASQTGDLRKAFDICRRAIDLIESETKLKHQQQLASQDVETSASQTALVDNINLSSPQSPNAASKQPPTLAASLARLTPENAPRASIAHVARIASAAFGNGALQRLQTLNLQQKAALCVLVSLEEKKRNNNNHSNGNNDAAGNNSSVPSTPSKHANAAPTVRALFDAYAGLCNRDRMLQPLSGTEFRDVVASLETQSLVGPADSRAGSFASLSSTPTTPSKRGRPSGSSKAMAMGFGGAAADERRVASCVSKKELLTAVQGVGAGILEGLLQADGFQAVVF